MLEGFEKQLEQIQKQHPSVEYIRFEVHEDFFYYTVFFLNAEDPKEFYSGLDLLKYLENNKPL